jgi:hypothetical protein
MKVAFTLLIAMMLAGCGSTLTGYNLKATIGQTDNDNGTRSIYTGGSVDAHFDVKPQYQR